MSKAADKEISSTPEEDRQTLKKKTPIPLKILAVLLIIAAVVTIPIMVLIIVALVMAPQEFLTEMDVNSFVIIGVLFVTLLISAVFEMIFAINLLRNKRRNARRMSEFLIVTTIVSMLCELMLEGLSISLAVYLGRLVLLVVVATYIDPALSEERALRRKLRKMETRDDAEEGTLGRDKTGKGFIQLDFFNLFWIFVVACILGLIIETIYHFILYGGYEDRAGMLYGPFSPIYGFGAVLMTVALNRFYKKSIFLIFIVSALIGGGFEFLVSWFLEFAFGIVAWDYSGTFLSIDGRTNGLYMFMWGVLGCFWIKLIMPLMLKLVNLIPWNWRYGLTTVCAALMIVNGALTLAAFDCWYQREAGAQPENALEQFCATYYDDDFMKDRFQTMSIDPSKTTRTN